MSNSDFLEEILFEGHRLGIIDDLMKEAKNEMDKGIYSHYCDAYLYVITRMVKEMNLQDSIFYPAISICG